MIRGYQSVVCCLLLICMVFALTGCRFSKNGSEPEQILAVCAVGLDPAPDGGYRLCIELPPTGDEAEAGRAELLCREGSTPAEILRELSLGQSRRLLFSHCAVLILGEGLTQAQLEESFSFFAGGELLPLAAQVLSAESAEALLLCSGYSAPAAGYALPGILRRQSELSGFTLRCSLYELYGESDRAAAVLPYFAVEGEGDELRAAFSGLQLLRAEGEAIRLSVREAVAYALLTDCFSESRKQPGSDYAQGLKQQKNSLQAGVENGEPILRLCLELQATEGAEQKEYDAWQEQLTREVQGLYDRLRQEPGALPGLLERLGQKELSAWSGFSEEPTVLLHRASLQISCRITERGAWGR